MPDPEARRDHADRLDVHDARQPAHRVNGVGRQRPGKRHGHVLAHRTHELLVDEHVHHVEERKPDQQDRAGEGDADHRHGRPQRLALDVPQHHARGLRQTAQHAPPFPHALPVLDRRVRPHGLGRRHRHGAAHRRLGARAATSGAHNDPTATSADRR
jgi:hypothetical protein